MAQENIIPMFAIFWVLLANIHPPKLISFLPMLVVNQGKVFVGAIHAILSIVYLEKQNKK
jgi:hypothetical protein